MPRIAKSDVNAALSLAAKSIITAGGPDGRTSRAEMKAALAKLPKEQRALADVFFKFIDHRDFKAGAQVTAKDVNKAVTYAKQHMVAKYDLNSNGLSKDEVARMSLTGRNAVALAKALKAAGAVDDGGGKLNAQKLGDLVAQNRADAWYMSESDYQPEFLNGTLPAGHDLNAHNTMTLFRSQLEELFEGSGNFPQGYGIEQYSARDARTFINNLRTAHDPADDMGVKSANAFGTITRALEANLTDVKVFRVGPGDSRGVQDDQGLYGKLIVGKTADGKIAGILLGSVET